MNLRTFLIISLLAPLAGCIATPRQEYALNLDFQYIQPEQPPVMSYNDLLCCLDCKA